MKDDTRSTAADLHADVAVAFQFLRTLRPDGPWVLTAIIPDGKTVTITARNETEVREFIETHDDKVFARRPRS
jgi:hypothetical protein